MKTSLAPGMFVIAILLTLATLGTKPASAEDVSVTDDFEDRDITDDPVSWRSYSHEGTSTFDASSGDLVITTTSERMTAAWIETTSDSHKLENTSIRAQVRVAGVSTRIALIAQLLPSLDTWVDGSITPNGSVWIRYVHPGAFDQTSRVQTDFQPIKEDVMLQLDVVGNEVSFYAWRPGESMPEAPQVTMTVPSVQRGSTGIAYYNSTLDTTLTVREIQFASEPIRDADDGVSVKDEFLDGDTQDGNPVSWAEYVDQGNATFEVTDGNLVMTSTGNSNTNAIWVEAQGQNHQLENTSVRGQVRLSGQAERVTVFSQGQIAQGKWVVGALETGGRLYLRHFEARKTSAVLTDFRVAEEDVVLQLDVIGDEATLYAWRPGESMPEEPQVSLTLPAVQVGTLGGGMNRSDPETSVTFRYLWFASEPIRDEGIALYDDFDAGDYEYPPVAWKLTAQGPATMSAESGDLVVTPSGSFNALWVEPVGPDDDLQDASVRTQVRLSGAGQRVWLWSQAWFGDADGNKWVTGILYRNGDLELRHQHSNLRSTVQTDFRVAEEDVVLQLDVIGTKASLYAWRPGEPMPDAPQVSIDLPSVQPGILGGGMNGPDAETSLTFRYLWFQSKPITDGDLPEPPPIVPQIKPEKDGVTIEVHDRDGTFLDPDTVVLKIDDEIAPPNVSKVGDLTTIAYEYSPIESFSPGAQHTYALKMSAEQGEDFSWEGRFEVPIAFLPLGVPLPGPEGVDGAFGVRYLWAAETIDSLDRAVEVIQSASDPEFTGRVFDTTHALLNHGEDPTRGLFGADRNDFPSEVLEDEAWTNDDFVQLAKGTLLVEEGGTYTFGIHSDDGFALRILGSEFKSVSGNGEIDPASGDSIIHPSNTANSNTRAVIDLTAGRHDIEFLWWDRSGEAIGELSVAKGAFLEDSDTDTWELVGPGLPLVGAIDDKVYGFDGFDDGDYKNGPVAWALTAQGPATMSAESGDLVVSPSGSFNALWVEPVGPDYELQDASVRTQVRLSGTGQRVWIWSQARLSDADGWKWVAGILFRNGDLVLYHEHADLKSQVQTDFRVAEEDVVLQLDVIGTKAKLYAWRPGEPMPETPQASLDLPSVQPGILGGGMNDPDAETSLTFRYLWFQSKPITDGAAELRIGSISQNPNSTELSVTAYATPIGGGAPHDVSWEVQLHGNPAAEAVAEEHGFGQPSEQVLGIMLTEEVTSIWLIVDGVKVQTISRDRDGDGMPDDYEILHELDLNDPADADLDKDNDRLTNLQEFDRQTDPEKTDTDGDGFGDKVETGTGLWVSSEDTGTDPRIPDTDGDGLGDGAETATGVFVSAANTGTNANLQDSDADGFGDGREVDQGSDPTDKDSVPQSRPEFLIDFAGDGADSSGVSPDPWISINELVQDKEVELNAGVTLTALDDGFSPNNPAPPNEDAEYDGVTVPQEARDDYLFKTVDTVGTEARMRIDGLEAGTYKVTIFEGRLTDFEQYAKIWVGAEPQDENTGNFARESATVEVVIGKGDVLWYKHLEDGTGGISGMIIRQTSSGVPTFQITGIALSQDQRTVDIAWDSLLNVIYAIDTSDDLRTWIELANGIESEGRLTSVTVDLEFLQPLTGYFRVRETPPLRADFENGPAGWTSLTISGETHWELGAPVNPALINGETENHAWGTNLDADYSSEASASLRSPVVDLGVVNHSAILSFQYHIDSIEGVEGGQLQILNETGEKVLYTHDSPFTGTTATWTSFTLQVPQTLQDQKIVVEFLFMSDPDDIVGSGWYIDDVMIR